MKRKSLNNQEYIQIQQVYHLFSFLSLVQVASMTNHKETNTMYLREKNLYQ